MRVDHPHYKSSGGVKTSTVKYDATTVILCPDRELENDAQLHAEATRVALVVARHDGATRQGTERRRGGIVGRGRAPRVQEGPGEERRRGDSCSHAELSWAAGGCASPGAGKLLFAAFTKCWDNPGWRRPPPCGACQPWAPLYHMWCQLVLPSPCLVPSFLLWRCVHRSRQLGTLCTGCHACRLHGLGSPAPLALPR